MKLLNKLKIILSFVYAFYFFLSEGMEEYKPKKITLHEAKCLLKNVVNINYSNEDAELSFFSLAVEFAEIVFDKVNNQDEQKTALAIVELFLKEGDDVNQFVERWNANALERVILKSQPIIPLIRLLIAYGANAEDDVLAALPKDSTRLKKELLSSEKFKGRIETEPSQKMPLRYLIVHKSL